MTPEVEKALRAYRAALVAYDLDDAKALKEQAWWADKTAVLGALRDLDQALRSDPGSSPEATMKLDDEDRARELVGCEHDGSDPSPETIERVAAEFARVRAEGRAEYEEERKAADRLYHAASRATQDRPDSLEEFAAALSSYRALRFRE